MRKPLLLLLITLALLAGIAANAALLSDKVLEKPVTLSVKGEALCDIFPILREQTGVRFQVGRDIADQKATIYVDDKPLRQVMEGLSTLFGYHWTKKTFSTGDIYELWQEDSARRRLADEYTKAWESAWNAANADIELKAKLAAMSKEERESFRRRITDSGKADSPEAKSQLEALKWVEDQLVGPSAAFFGKISAEARKTLQPGVKICYNTLSPESEWVLPEATAQALLDALRTHASNAISEGDLLSSGFDFACTETADAVDITATLSPTVGTAARGYSISRMGTWLTHQSVSEYLPSAGPSLPRIADVSGLEQPISITFGDIAEEAAQGGDSRSSLRVNRSDIIAIMHRKLGLQIISDHYSQWEAWNAPGDMTLLDIVRALDTSAPSFPIAELRATWGWDGKLLYMRTKDIWYSDALEIPNRLLRKWAASYRDRGDLDLYEQASIAALTREQFAQLERNREYLGLRKDPGIPNTSVLRLFGLMSEKQQKEALGGGTSVDRFTPEQRKALSQLQPCGGGLLTISNDGVPTLPVGAWTNSPPEYRLDKPQDDATAQVPVSVSLREGVSQASGEVSARLEGSNVVGPASARAGTLMAIGQDGDTPGGISYTMVISFWEGRSIEVVTTIPGGEPETLNDKQEEK